MTPRALVRGILAVTFALTILLATRSAFAQEYLPATSLQVASGVAGGVGGLQRAQTRLRLALELRLDEQPNDALVGAALLDVEPTAQFGGELRYLHLLSRFVAISGGGMMYLTPGTLIGPCAGIEVRTRLTEKTFFTAGPEATAFVFGTALEDKPVVWQTLLQLGVRTDF